MAIKSFGDIQVVAEKPSPESEGIVLRLELPENGSVVNDKQLMVQLRVRNYALGTYSPMSRVDEVMNHFKEGQNVRLIIDNMPAIIKAGPSIEPFDEDRDYAESTFRFYLPISLSNGVHTIKAFLCRSFGESLKEEGCFDEIYFYQNVREGKANFEEPSLLYNEPQGPIKWQKGKAVLLDFYVVGVVLSSDGYKVKLTLDGETKILHSWAPYYIYGLSRGEHNINLTLIDDKGMAIKSVDRNFVLE